MIDMSGIILETPIHKMQSIWEVIRSDDEMKEMEQDTEKVLHVVARTAVCLLPTHAREEGDEVIKQQVSSLPSSSSVAFLNGVLRRSVIS